VQCWLSIQGHLFDRTVQSLALSLRTTSLQNCAVSPRRARTWGSWTLLSPKSMLKDQSIWCCSAGKGPQGGVKTFHQKSTFVTQLNRKRKRRRRRRKEEERKIANSLERNRHQLQSKERVTKKFQGPLPENQGQNLAETVLSTPKSPESGLGSRQNLALTEVARIWP